MIISRLERQTLPEMDVFVQGESLSLVSADDALADEVKASFAQTRDRILHEFGGNSLDVASETLAQVHTFFHEREWSIPRPVVINPQKDAERLRNILSESHFRSPSDEEFFTGANDKPASPGCSVQYDLVIFHNWRDKYREEVRQQVASWGYSVADDELERIVELRVADFIIHELSHLAGHLAVSAVALIPTDKGYDLAENTTAGFTHIDDNVRAATLDTDSSYYSGPAMDEGWAAMQASRFILSIDGRSHLELPISERYLVPATIFKGEVVHSLGVSGLHSGEAGVIMESMDKLYPGILAVMTKVANGEVGLKSALVQLRASLPDSMYSLLLEPTHEAWQRLQFAVDSNESFQEALNS